MWKNILSVLDSIKTDIHSHTSNTNNPHKVTIHDIGAAAHNHTHDDRYYTESEIDNYNLITTSEIDNICQIPIAKIAMDFGDCSSDISFEEAKSYIENFGRLYVYVKGTGPGGKRMMVHDKINWIVTIHELKNNNTLINIDPNITHYHIEWTSSQIEVVIDPPR